MITMHDIAKTARHIARRGEGYRDRRIMHPARDWLIGFLVAILLFLGSAAGSGYLFWKNMTRSEEEATVEPVTYDPKLVRNVLSGYRAREERYESLRGDAILVSGDVTDTATSTAATSTPAEVPVAE